MHFRQGLIKIWLHLRSVLLPRKRTNTLFTLNLNLNLNLTLCLFFTLNAFAQPNLTLQPNRQYTLRNGLSQMQVTSMMQDSRGYLWVGTKAGLNCFNGEKFTNYTSGKFPAITNDYIFDIREDSFGRIWSCTASGIVRIDGEQIRFFPMESYPSTFITPGEHGRLWFCQTNFPNPVYKIGYIEQDSLYLLNAELPVIDKYDYVQIFYSKKEKTLLLGADTILYTLKNDRFEQVDINLNRVVFLPNLPEAFYLNSALDLGKDTIDLKNCDLKQYTNGGIQVVARIRNGQYLNKTLLTTSVLCRVALLPYETCLLTPDSVNLQINPGLPANATLLDREEQIWIGSEEGLYQLFDNGFTVFNKEELPQVWAVIEDKNSNIWFSSYIKGLYTLDGNNLTHYPNYFRKETGRPYFHPSRDKRGRLFFPNAHGILMVDGDRFEQQSERIYLTTCYDTERDLLWGGAGQRATVFDANRKIIRIIDKSQGLEVGNNVLTIGRDTSGYFWLGGGRGLARYHWETNSLKNYNPGGKNWGVTTQCTDSKGRTWFGSKGGLLWYDATADSLVRIDREELSDVVNMVGTIDSTWLIASQPFGIYLIDLQKYYRSGEIVLYLYNEKNGFQGEEPGQDGVFNDSKGYVWITTGTHLIRLDPRKLKTAKFNLNVRIDKCNGKKLPYTSGMIELPRNQSSAIITLDAICFNRPNPVQYAWKLGKDSLWSDWQEEDYIVLSGLTDGLHRLEVKARVKGLPLETSVLTSQQIRVQMAFYRQAWFFPAIFILISFLGTGFLIFALTRMRKAGRDARIFQVQAIQSQMNPHFIFNVLASLQTMILKAEISKANDYLVKLADLIRGFLEASAGSGILKNPKSDEGLVTLDSELKMLSEFVEFQQEIFPGRFEFRKDISGEVDIHRQKIPPMLIQPFVENAIRHGLLPSENPGILSLRISKTADHLLITISDNGIGVEKSAELNRKSTLRYISRGKELTLKRISLLNKLGFPIEVLTDSNSKGTTITISMSL